MSQLLRSIPTRTLNGIGGETKAKEILEKWDTKDWSKDGKHAVERELSRRKRRQKKAQIQANSAAEVIPSAAGLNGDGTL